MLIKKTSLEELFGFIYEGWKKVHSSWIQEGNFSDDNFVEIQPGIKTFQSSISCFSEVLAGQWAVVLSTDRNAKLGAL